MKKGLELLEEYKDDRPFDIALIEPEKDRQRREMYQRAVGSPEGWKASWREGTFTHAQIEQVCDNSEPKKYFDGWRWIEGKKIKVFTDGDVKEYAVEPVRRGIQELIDDLGLDIEVKYYPKYASHPSVTGPIELSIKGDFIDAVKLARYFMAEIWRYPPHGSQHADVLITNRPLLAGGENFGQSRFDLGCMVISLSDGTNNPKDRRNRQEPGMHDLVRRIAKHETGHLLGYQLHHEDVQVAGYAEPRDCAMYWQASTDRFCDKCRDALLGFWEGLEDKTGLKFFK